MSTYKTCVYSFPILKGVNPVGNLFLFKIWKRLYQEKENSNWITIFTLNPIEYLENLRWRIAKKYRRVTRKREDGIRVVELNLLYPVLEGYPLSEVSEEQREAYLIQQDVKHMIFGKKNVNKKGARINALNHKIALLRGTYMLYRGK